MGLHDFVNNIRTLSGRVCAVRKYAGNFRLGGWVSEVLGWRCRRVDDLVLIVLVRLCDMYRVVMVVIRLGYLHSLVS